MRQSPPNKHRERGTQDVSVCRHGPLAPPTGVCPCERDCYCRDPKSAVAAAQKCDPGAHVYWITRDSEPDGSLSESCDIWVLPPRRLRYDAEGPGAFWMGFDGEWSLVGHYQVSTVAAVRAWCNTVPDTDVECIRVG